jgi:hypothetical protein
MRLRSAITRSQPHFGHPRYDLADDFKPQRFFLVSQIGRRSGRQRPEECFEHSIHRFD